jgi:hypothetical protein
MYGLESSSPGENRGAGCCEHGNERSDPVTVGGCCKWTFVLRYSVAVNTINKKDNSKVLTFSFIMYPPLYVSIVTHHHHNS